MSYFVNELGPDFPDNNSSFSISFGKFSDLNIVVVLGGKKQTVEKWGHTSMQFSVQNMAYSGAKVVCIQERKVCIATKPLLTSFNLNMGEKLMRNYLAIDALRSGSSRTSRAPKNVEEMGYLLCSNSSFPNYAFRFEIPLLPDDVVAGIVLT